MRLGCPTRSPEYDSDAIDDGARYARNDFSVSYRVRGRSLARAHLDRQSSPVDERAGQLALLLTISLTRLALRSAYCGSPSRVGKPGSLREIAPGLTAALRRRK